MAMLANTRLEIGNEPWFAMCTNPACQVLPRWTCDECEAEAQHVLHVEKYTVGARSREIGSYLENWGWSQC
jgi:hypothetical protein